MKIIEEQYIKDRNGEIVEVQTRDTEASEESTLMKLNLSWVLARVCNSYTPSPELTLPISEIRSLQKILDILEDKKLKIGGKLEFEDEHYKVLKKVALHILPTVVYLPLLMAAPQIEDILNNPT